MSGKVSGNSSPAAATVASILDGFGDRLAEGMQDPDISGYQLAKDLGHKRADTVYNIVNKRQYANLKLIVELLQLFPEVNANWLVLGRGAKYQVNEADQQQQARNFIESIRTLADTYEQQLSAKDTPKD
jgi:plasmid maintenance system antidote protein VapI